VAAAGKLLVQNSTNLDCSRGDCERKQLDAAYDDLNTADPIPGANKRLGAKSRCNHGLLNIQYGGGRTAGVALETKPRPYRLQTPVRTTPAFVILPVLKVVVVLVPPVYHTNLRSLYHGRGKSQMNVYKLAVGTQRRRFVDRKCRSLSSCGLTTTTSSSSSPSFPGLDEGASGTQMFTR